MHDVEIVKSLEALHHLDEDAPDLFLVEVRLPFLMVNNLLEDISIVSELHHNAKSLALIINESLFVGDDAWVLDRCQNSNFVKSIFPLLV